MLNYLKYSRPPCSVRYSFSPSSVVMKRAFRVGYKGFCNLNQVDLKLKSVKRFIFSKSYNPRGSWNTSVKQQQYIIHYRVEKINLYWLVSCISLYRPIPILFRIHGSRNWRLPHWCSWCLPLPLYSHFFILFTSLKFFES